ncbi:MAG: Rieske (2Fe-2S) protein [Pirellulales bacterium]
MAEKKKMSVADILAAARKTDASKSDAAEPAAPAAGPEASSPVEPAAEAPPAAAKPSPAAAKAAAGGARPSVADILAAARAAKGAQPPAAAAPAAASKPAAAKPAAEKPKAAEKPAAAAPGGPKDTASILAAARKGARPGPVTKSEAAARASAVAAPAKPEKNKPSAPPMPAKPDYAKPKAKAAAEEDRRSFLHLFLGTMMGLGFTSLATASGLWTLGLARFMFPNILTEPPSRFKVGFPSNFAPGQVETKFIAQFGVWVVNGEYNGQAQIYALRSVCTHLGCTPNWLEGEQKFKCPCHGSGFYKDGINFEGPAPRPLERYAIRVADDGQLEIDKSKIFQEEMGQWTDPTSFVTA